MSRMLRSIVLLIGVAWSATSPSQTVTNTSSSEPLKQGESLGVFYVTKVAGAVDDGVEVGEDLCYRCRYGSSPMVIVFTRKTDGKIPQLVRKIESAVLAHKESRLRGLVTVLGDDSTKLKERAGQIAKQTDVKTVPIVIAKEHDTGPPNYKLPADAEVTIVIANDSQVVKTYCRAAERIDVDAVMKTVLQILN